MRRWGQISEPKPANWYHETAKQVYRPDIYLKAAKRLIGEGFLTEAEVPFGTDGYKPPTTDFIDGVAYDARHPIDYINSHKIGIKDSPAIAKN